jgi:phosphatidylglycerol:prolipoprotein diacylglycerol transferase
MIDPIAFSIFGIDIMWYGVLIATGIIVAVILSLREAKRVGEKEDNILDLLIWVLPAAIIGARTYYVLFELSYYKNNPSEIFAIRNGGLAIHGGVIAAFLVGYIFVKKKNLSFFKLADIVAPGLILAQAIGRWGNFINQEAFGGVVTENFISIFPSFIRKQMFIDGQYYHPTFLYESIWNLIIFAFLIFYRKKFKKKDGELIAIYAIGYSIGRFFIEGMRTDSLMLGPLRIAQVVSLILIVLGVILLYWKRKKETVISDNS